MTEINYISPEAASVLPGLRIAFTKGLPGPWGEAARAFFDIKKIPYHAVAQDVGESNDALRAWTGQTSAPVAVLNDERPRAHWSELLMLAERLAPEPRLIPEDEDDRATMFGLCHELCGEGGFGWSARLMLFDAFERSGNPTSPIMVAKYAHGAPVEEASARVKAVVGLLARRLEAQAAKGSRYLVGDALSAADIYWTTFSNLIHSIPLEICPMPDFYRTLPDVCGKALDGPLPEILIQHRDRILRDHFILPMRF